MSATWIDCTRVDGVAPPACVAVLKKGEMVLRLQGRTERGHHILGTAIVQDDGPNVLASVYVESIADRSTKTGLPLWIILGRVTAHEIGHLLLGTNSHTVHGLMQAKWDLRRPHLAEWQFTSADAAKIRSRLRPRPRRRRRYGRRVRALNRNLNVPCGWARNVISGPHSTSRPLPTLASAIAIAAVEIVLAPGPAAAQRRRRVEPRDRRHAP